MRSTLFSSSARVLSGVVLTALMLASSPVLAQACPDDSDPYRDYNGYRLIRISGTQIQYSWPASTTVSNPEYEVILATAPGHCSLAEDPRTQGSYSQYSVVATTSTETSAIVTLPAENALRIAVRIKGCSSISRAVTVSISSNTFSTKPGLPTILYAGNPEPGLVRVETSNPDELSSYSFLQRLGRDGIFRDINSTEPPDCPPAGPHTMYDRGAIDGRNYSGPGRLPADTYTYRVWRASGEGINYSEPFVVVVDLDVEVNRAVVTLSRAPAGFVQTANVEQSGDEFVLANSGNLDASLTLSPSGDFFDLSSTSIVIPPGESRSIQVTSTQQPSGVVEGSVTVTGSGLTVPLEIPIKLLSVDPAASTASVRSGEARIDVSAPFDEDLLEGSVEIVNDGSEMLTGVLFSDAPWLIPPKGEINVSPGSSKSVEFTIDRYLRPDAPFISGSVYGKLQLRYPSATDSNGKTIADGPPATATSFVVAESATQPALATPIPALESGEVGLSIAGVGNVKGSAGTFVTDLVLYNTAGSPIKDLRMYFVAGGQSLRTSQPIGPTTSMNLADLAATTFSSEGIVGTLHLRSNDIESLRAVASVFNKSRPDGTYGTAIPTFRSDRSIANGESLWLTGLTKTETRHTNLYLQEVRGNEGKADIRFFDQDGAVLPADPELGQSIPAFGLVQILQDRVPAGAVVAKVTNLSSGQLVAYATPVDRSSGDTWAVTDWTRYANRTSGERFLIPVAGSLPGANQTYFRTDLWITNTGDSSSSITIHYWERQASGSMASFPKTITLKPTETIATEDVVVALFERPTPSVGYLTLTPSTGGTFIASSRTYTAEDATSRSYGTTVPTLPGNEGLGFGDSKLIGGLRDATHGTIAARTPITYRTNIGLVETSGKPATVRITALFMDGKGLAANQRQATKDYTLDPNEWSQINSFLSELLGDDRASFGDLDNIQIRTEVIGGEGSVLVYVTTTDNGTGDTVFRLD